ncbi:MAG: hypothetical protein IPP44_15055 [Ideonella sp.]|nr:hypothetical protein [Ideonella sp.]
MNAIPPAARATLHPRFVVGTDASRMREHLLAHLARHGFGDITVSELVDHAGHPPGPGQRLRTLAMQAIEQHTGIRPSLCCPTGARLTV